MKGLGMAVAVIVLVAGTPWLSPAVAEVSKGDFKKRCVEMGGTYDEGPGRYSCCFADFCVDCWLPYQVGGSTTCYKRCTTPKCSDAGKQIGPDDPNAFEHFPVPPATPPSSQGALETGKAVPVQHALKVLSHRMVKGTLETMLAFSKDGDGPGRIQTKTEPQMAADEVAVRGRNGTAIVHVRGVCAGKTGGALHLAHELVVTVAMGPGLHATLSVGTVEQRVSLAEVCGARLPAPKREGEEKKRR